MNNAPRKKEDLNKIEIIENGVIGIRAGKIEKIWVEENSGMKGKIDTISAKGKIVMPGFVDVHTHLGKIFVLFFFLK